MQYETIDELYRSRRTLLEHLDEQGYDTAPYMKFSHKEIMEMVKAGPMTGAPPALQMDLVSKDGLQKCMVVTTLGKIKQKLNPFTSKLIDPEETSFDPVTTELIIITLEPIAPNFHAMAYHFWSNKKTRVRYFQAKAIINNPLKHILVPPHEKVPKEEETALLKQLYAKKSQFPLIRFHEDPIARMLGLLPGDIVKITRASPTAGVYKFHRVCVP
jgi:DNA-directed RNA polymerase subunit H (RpoH/RPB5)